VAITHLAPVNTYLFPLELSYFVIRLIGTQLRWYRKELRDVGIQGVSLLPIVERSARYQSGDHAAGDALRRIRHKWDRN
jgi:hypothetical protein